MDFVCSPFNQIGQPAADQVKQFVLAVCLWPDAIVIALGSGQGVVIEKAAANCIKLLFYHFHMFIVTAADELSRAAGTDFPRGDVSFQSGCIFRKNAVQ